MKIKKNDYVDDLDVDKILTEEYDLGFLLDQIKNKKITLWSPSIIDVLRFIPKFYEAVIQIRKELQVKPLLIKSILCTIIGKKKFMDYSTVLKRIARVIPPFPDPNREGWEIYDQIEGWKKKEFSSLSRKVAEIRLKVLGKAPHTWQEAIENYVLFEQISPTPIIYRRQGAEINVKQDNETREYYMEIKIYADTDTNYLPKRNQLKKIQQSLPAYCDPREWDENLIIARFMQYVLRRHLKLTQKQTLEWLEKHSLIAPDYQHTSQELRRFEDLFMSVDRK